MSNYCHIQNNKRILRGLRAHSMILKWKSDRLWSYSRLLFFYRLRRQRGLMSHGFTRYINCFDSALLFHTIKGIRLSNSNTHSQCLLHIDFWNCETPQQIVRQTETTKQGLSHPRSIYQHHRQIRPHSNSECFNSPISVDRGCKNKTRRRTAVVISDLTHA